MYDKPENGGNGDRVINNGDAIFLSLQLWARHKSQRHLGAVRAAQFAGTRAQDFRPGLQTNQNGLMNMATSFAIELKVKDMNDAQMGRWAWDVFLVSAP